MLPLLAQQLEWLFHLFFQGKTLILQLAVLVGRSIPLLLPPVACTTAWFFSYRHWLELVRLLQSPMGHLDNLPLPPYSWSGASSLLYQGKVSQWSSLPKVGCPSVFLSLACHGLVTPLSTWWGIDLLTHFFCILQSYPRVLIIGEVVVVTFRCVLLACVCVFGCPRWQVVWFNLRLMVTIPLLLLHCSRWLLMFLHAVLHTAFDTLNPLLLLNFSSCAGSQKLA